MRGLSGRDQRGILTYGSMRVPCALGRSGRRVRKLEGDGATPIGRFAVRQALYRADRLRRPRTLLPLVPLRADDGWCDDPQNRNYNRHVRHPYRASAERLWRTDGLYDLIIVTGHNERPRVRGRGSAVFIHVAGPGLVPTAGCIGLRLGDLKRLIGHMRRGTILDVRA
ncbi:MAG: L,D-transpeptidase family protein [Gemmatimonadetes bacterium]|nr:L,D-transpeptidase family protein [Gemmatimonadota bacterium]